MTTRTSPTADLAGRLVEFVEALRSKGIPAGPSETIDAADVVRVLGMEHRELLREGLAASLVRRGGQRDVFDMTFDLYFPLATGAPQAVREAALDPEADVAIDDLRDLLAMALSESDLRTMEQIAELAVDALGRIDIAGGQQGGYSAFQTLERMQPQTTLVNALSMRESSGDVLDDRLAPDELRRLIQLFRQMVEA
ncbi:MAG TPA: hypothetical protein VK948_09345, partial [Aeromicrobium sp.]|nr:hypothetical protein [Aeromicrobium sp.]